MSVQDLEGFSRWMRPALARLNQDTLDRYGSWADALQESGPPVGDLVLAAHSRFPRDLLADIEDRMAAETDYDPAGKAVLVARLAGAVVMAEISPTTADTDRSVAGALSVMSARFIGMTPVFMDLYREARVCLDRVGRTRRARISAPKTPAPTRRRKTGEQPADDDFVNVMMQRTELATRDSQISTLAKRLDESAVHQDRHLLLIDEEADALWWSRSDASWTTGQTWVSMTPIDRAVTAGVEVGALVRVAPAARAHQLLLGPPVVASDCSHGLSEILEAMSRTPSANDGPAADGRTTILRPLAYASAGWSPAAADAGSWSRVHLELGLDAGWQRSGIEIAQQLLIERCLEMISQ